MNLAVVGVLAGCAAVVSTPDLGGLYSELASYRNPQRNPIVMIPGFMGLFAVALSFLRAPDGAEVSRLDETIDRDYGGERGETCLRAADGERICYTVCNRLEGRTIAGVGGLFVGMISTGLGELNGYFLLRRCRVPSKVSVATSVFVVALTALSAATAHLVQFVDSGPEVLATVRNLVIFTVPGVILGAQMGSALASRIPQHTLERAMGLLFLVVAALTLGEALL